MKSNLKIKLAFAVILALLGQQGNINFALAHYSPVNSASLKQTAGEQAVILPMPIVVTQVGQAPAAVAVADSLQTSLACLAQKASALPGATYVQDQSVLNLNEPAGCFSLAVRTLTLSPVGQSLQVSSHPVGQLPRVAVASFPVQISAAVDAALPVTPPIPPILPLVISVAVLWEFGERPIKASSRKSLAGQGYKPVTVFGLQTMRC